MSYAKQILLIRQLKLKLKLRPKIMKTVLCEGLLFSHCLQPVCEPLQGKIFAILRNANILQHTQTYTATLCNHFVQAERVNEHIGRQHA